jgi:hypothetical protein
LLCLLFFKEQTRVFQYIQVTGGNKYREGYQYKITNLDETNGLNGNIENALRQTLENIKAEHSKTVGQSQPTNTQTPITKGKNSKTTKNSKK